MTFIHQGRIIFSENKDDVLGRYSVVQGPKADLNPDLKARLLGLRNGSFGFEGLCTDVDAIRSRLSNQCVVERASLDQIMLYLVHEDRSKTMGEVRGAGTHN